MTTTASTAATDAGTAAPATRAEHCVVACAEAWRGGGEILAAPIGAVPRVGALLARRTFSPDLLITDGEAMIIGDGAGHTEGWLPYRKHLSATLGGKRHIMMGGSQIDRYGNQNISCIGDWAQPKRQLIGSRGAPSNTVNNTVSYWVPRHSARVLVERVDVVSGVGYDRAAEAGTAASRFHGLGRVVTDLAVLDFDTPDHRMRIAAVHPGVTVEQVQETTGFELAVTGEVPFSRTPVAEELRLIRQVLDPSGSRDREVRA